MKQDMIRRYALSSLTTFLAFFLLSLGTQLQMAGEMEFTSSFFFGMISVAVRAGVKAVVEMMPAVIAGVKDKLQ